MDKEYYYYSFKSLILLNVFCIFLYSFLIFVVEYYRFNRFSTICGKTSYSLNDSKSEDMEHCIGGDTNIGECFFQIRRLNKQFGELKAVDNFNCDFEKGKLFVLLGHNGAGKSTLINMVAGVHEPSSGGIYLEGENMVENREVLFKNLGLCDQEDVFYETFTVEENLLLMQNLKTGSEDQEEIRKYLNTLKIFDKLYCTASELSGGQKRKLCLSMSLIGKSKLVILDEPTSGMDVFARKDVWSLLKEVKQDRCIILTTHSMDEAELVSDEIGIMADGVLIERGTAFELKSKIGNEFTVNIIKKHPESTDKQAIKQFQEELFAKIKSITEEAKLKINSKEVLKITVSCNEEVALNLFTFLDSKAKEGKIDDYSYSSVTLEDFFLSTNKHDDNTETNISTLTSVQLGENSVSIFKEAFLNVKFRLFALIRDYQTYLFNLIVALVFLNGFIYILQSNNIGTPEFEKSDTFNGNIKFAYLRDPSVSGEAVKRFIPKEVSQFDLNTEKLDSPEDFLAYLVKQNFSRNAYHVIIYFKTANIEGIEAFMMQNRMLSISGLDYLIKANIALDADVLSPSFDYFNEDTQESIQGVQTGLSILFSFIFLFSCLRLIISSMRSIVYERVQNIKHLQNMYGIRSLTYWFGIYVVDILKTVIFLALGWNLFKWFTIPIEDTLYLISALILVILVYYYLITNLFSDYTWVETGLTIYSLVVIYVMPYVYIITLLVSGNTEDFTEPSYSPILFIPEVNFVVNSVKLPMFPLN